MTLNEAKEQMLKKLDDGLGVLVSVPGLGIHTIHEISPYEGSGLQSLTEVVHCGFGLFRSSTPSGEFYFNGGGAMERCDLFAWTDLWAKNGNTSEILKDLGYDVTLVREVIEKLEE
jgi:hypothetical protein